MISSPHFFTVWLLAELGWLPRSALSGRPGAAWEEAEHRGSSGGGDPGHAMVVGRYLVDVSRLVGGLEHFLFSHILGIIIPID